MANIAERSRRAEGQAHPIVSDWWPHTGRHAFAGGWIAGEIFGAFLGVVGLAQAMAITVSALWAIGLAAAIIIRPSHTLRAGIQVGSIIDVWHADIRVAQIAVITFWARSQRHWVIAWLTAMMGWRHA